MIKKRLALSDPEPVEGESKGFTLVEMLVVIAVLAVFGTLILVIFTRTLRGGGKAQIIGTIKQNGQSVLEVMDKTVRNADAIYCPNIVPPDTSAASNTLVVLKDGVFTRLRIVLQQDISRPNAPTIYPSGCQLVNNRSNGCIIQDNPLIRNPITNRDETDINFKNRVCNPTDPMVQAAILTDTNTQTGVSVDCVASLCTLNPVFFRDSAAGYKDQLTIKFDLKAAVGAPQVVGPIDPVTFQTTVQLRL